MFQAHGDAMLIVPPPDTQISVRGLLNLTPGDFASALRQSRFRPIETAQALFDVIVCVCAMKGGAAQGDRLRLKAQGWVGEHGLSLSGSMSPTMNQ